MKKAVSILFCSYICLIIFCGQAHAVKLERLTSASKDYEELTTRCTERVVDGINDLSGFPNSTVDERLSADEIDWRKAYKVYVDESDIFAITKPVSMSTLTEKMNYVWVLPVRSGDISVNVTLSIELPLDESIRNNIVDAYGEEKWEQMKADVGHWNPVEYEVSSTTAETYEKILSAVGLRDQKRAALVGGTPRMRSAFAIVEDEQQISIVSMTPENENDKLSGIKMRAQEQSGVLVGQKVYRFEQAQQILSGVPIASQAGGGSGGMSSFFALVQWIGVFSVLALMCAVCGYFATKSRRK